MIKQSRLLGVAVLVTFFAGNSLAAQDRQQNRLRNVKLTADVEYRKVGKRSLHVDVLQPKQAAAEKLPVVVWIHGGGWQGGNKRSALGRIVPLVASGKYAGVAVEYRLSDAAQWPEQIYDCKAAIRWIRAHAEEYGFDPERIAVWGSSAGGHLVSMLGTSGEVKQLEGDGPHLDQSSRVTCVVDFCGPSNLAMFARPGKGSARAETPISKLLGGPLEEKLELAKHASPSTYVTADDPPFLVVHGTHDATVPFSQAEHLCEKLKHAEVDVTFVKIEGGGHGIGGKEVYERVEKFLAKHLLGEEVEVSTEPIEK